MLGNLIGGFITILIGATLMPTVADSIYEAKYCNSTATSSGASFGCINNATFSSGHVSGSAQTVLGLANIFFALGVMSAGVAITAQGLRAAGMLGM